MLKVIGLKKIFGGQELFSDFSFNINKKEKVGLVGRNGHGKTTLFRIILGEVTPDEGEIYIPKDYRIGCVSQHLQFVKSNILEEVCLGLPETQEDNTWKAKKILHGLGFSEDDFLKSPLIFSGGFQIRLNLAKVLLSNPDLLLLDEPNNYLDIVAIRWLIDFLKTWSNELMLITHDRHFMDSVITHTIAIHRKKAKKIQGSTEKLYDQIEKEETIYENTRLNEEKKMKQTELFIRRFRAKARLAGMVQSRIKSLDKQQRKEKLEAIDALDFSFNYYPFPASMMMNVKNINFSYDNKEPYIINNFSIEINEQDRIAIIGKNGKGKSTLLKNLTGENKFVSGNIKMHGETKIGYFSQTNVKSLSDTNSIVEEIMSVDPLNINMQRARDIAGVLMFRGDDALKKISVLSGGEKNRVALGKILATPCNLLLLDEPTNHLDMESCDALLDAIDSFDGAVVMVTHNEMYLNDFADRLIVFDNKEIKVYEKTYEEFLEEVGWADEKEEIDAKSSSKNVKFDKKKIKKLRADIIQEKSKILNPLKNKLQDLEDKIVNLEDEKKVVENELTSASMNNDAQKIQKFSKRLHEINSDIQTFFDILEEKSEKLLEKEQEFVDRLKELDNQIDSK